MTLSTSSTTAVGTASWPISVAAVPLAAFLPLVAPLVVSPFLPAPSAAAALAWVSCRTSSTTRLTRAGKVVTSPDRRSDRACDWTAEGQLEGWAWRLWRSCSWILLGSVSFVRWNGPPGGKGEGEGRLHLSTWPSLSRAALIWDLRSGSRVAGV